MWRLFDALSRPVCARLLPSVIGLLIALGCSSPQDVLRDRTARYREEPTSDLVYALLHADPVTRQATIRRLVKLVEDGRGYERLVAIRALMQLSHYPECQSHFDQDAVLPLAQAVVRLSDLPPAADLKTVRDVPIGSYSQPLQVQFGVMVDGVWVELPFSDHRMFTDRGWKVIYASIALDGSPVAERTDEQIGIRQITVPLVSVCADNKLLGDHRWDVDATVVAPSGVRVRLFKTDTIKVIDGWEGH